MSAHTTVNQKIADQLCDCAHPLSVHLDYGDPGHVEWKCERCQRIAWHEFQQARECDECGLALRHVWTPLCDKLIALRDQRTDGSLSK